MHSFVVEWVFGRVLALTKMEFPLLVVRNANRTGIHFLVIRTGQTWVQFAENRGWHANTLFGRILLELFRFRIESVLFLQFFAGLIRYQHLHLFSLLARPRCAAYVAGHWHCCCCCCRCSFCAVHTGDAVAANFAKNAGQQRNCADNNWKGNTKIRGAAIQLQTIGNVDQFALCDHSWRNGRHWYGPIQPTKFRTSPDFLTYQHALDNVSRCSLQFRASKRF